VPAARRWSAPRGSAAARGSGRPRAAARARGEAAPPPRRARPRRPGLRSSVRGSLQLLERFGKAAERAARSCLHSTERDVQEIGDLGLGEAAPVRELQKRALVL